MRALRPLLFVLLPLLSACGGGGSATQPTTPAISYAPADTPADKNVRVEAKAILSYLAALSKETKDGVVVGQNMGHGNEPAIMGTTGLVGYGPLVAKLEQETGQAPGIIGVDYEHNRIFTPAELSAGNQVLISHWQRGGLVTINWAPGNPWWNDESDLVNHPGVWTDTRTTGGNMALVDMRQLINPASSIYPVWRRKLDRIATALQELQAAGVVVLWRPLQEMNGDWFWWGISSTPNDPSPYVNVWRDMFQYFTEVKGLHNLLWVYSPTAVVSNGFGGPPVIKPMSSHYPGAAYIDIVAPTTYSDTVSIPGYSEVLQLNKVLAMAELGTETWGPRTYSKDGSFDTTKYLTTLQRDYPAMAYWVAWHNWDNGNNSFDYQALVSNKNANILMQNPQTITLNRLMWRTHL